MIFKEYLSKLNIHFKRNTFSEYKYHTDLQSQKDSKITNVDLQIGRVWINDTQYSTTYRSLNDSST